MLETDEFKANEDMDSCHYVIPSHSDEMSYSQKSVVLQVTHKYPTNKFTSCCRYNMMLNP